MYKGTLFPSSKPNECCSAESFTRPSGDASSQATEGLQPFGYRKNSSGAFVAFTSF